MQNLRLFTILLLCGFSASFGSGCSKTPPSEDITAIDTTKLPGAAEIAAPLAKKDYDAAMAAWLKLKQTITTEEQRIQFLTLTRAMQVKLQDAAQSDPKAADALTVLRSSSTSIR